MPIDSSGQWVGIQPTDPAETIPVEEQSPLTELVVEGKAGGVPQPVTESSPLTEIAVEGKAGGVSVGVTESSPLTEIAVEGKAGGVSVGVTESAPLTEIEIKPVSPAQSIPVKRGTEEQAATATQGQTAVGTSSTEILAANASRISFLIKNIASVAVYVYFGDTATTANGIKLEDGDIIYGNCYTGKITGITSAGTATVSQIEV